MVRLRLEHGGAEPASVSQEPDELPEAHQSNTQQALKELDLANAAIDRLSKQLDRTEGLLEAERSVLEKREEKVSIAKHGM